MNKIEFETISKIANRGMGIALEHGSTLNKMSVVMDLESAHDSCPMDLDRFLDADDFNFAHDFFGIQRHMDRTEYPGRLTGCFVPRYSV